MMMHGNWFVDQKMREFRDEELAKRSAMRLDARKLPDAVRDERHRKINRSAIVAQQLRWSGV